MDQHTINAISICSGIGGLDRGVRRVLPAARVVLYCEREISAAAILASRMETQDLDKAAIWSDLESITGTECSDYIREATGGRGIDMLFGGPPCQGFSVAGKQLGADDERDMFPATLRAIEHYGPWVVFLENVPGSCGYVSERVIPALCGMGYRVPRPILLEAAAIGASQKRERLFVLAVKRSERLQGIDGSGAATRTDGRSGGIVEVADGDGPECETRYDVAVAGKSSRGRIGEPERDVAISARDGGPRLDWQGGRGRGVCGTSNEVGDAESHSGRAGVDGEPLKEGIGSRGFEDGSRALFGAFPPGPGLGLDRVVDKVLASLEAGEDDAGDCFLAELAEWAKWQRILEVRPDLAPATVERQIRRVADELPGKLGDDVSRADKLRALGNGVVADQAAAALRILFSRIGL